MNAIDTPVEKNEANARSRPRGGFGIWFEQHLYSFIASLGRAVRRPWATLLTVGVMAVAFALPLGLGLALDNVQRFAGNVQQSRQIDVFLKQDVAASRAQRNIPFKLTAITFLHCSYVMFIKSFLMLMPAFDTNTSIPPRAVSILLNAAFTSPSLLTSPQLKPVKSGFSLITRKAASSL